MKTMAEAIKVIQENGYRVINEEVYTSFFQLNKKIKEYLENDKFVVVLLMGMYGRQVDYEKAGRRTIDKNFRVLTRLTPDSFPRLPKRLRPAAY